MPVDPENKGQAKILGECDFDLESILNELVESEGLPVKRSLKFGRDQGGNLVTVGRFVATFKIQGDFNPLESEGSYLMESKRKLLSSIVDIDRELPQSEFGLNKWRVRIHARCAINAPSDKLGAPSLFMEGGWSQYKNEDPISISMICTETIDDNRHPIWNQELFLIGPPRVDKPCMLI